MPLSELDGIARFWNPEQLARLIDPLAQGLGPMETIAQVESYIERHVTSSNPNAEEVVCNLLSAINRANEW